MRTRQTFPILFLIAIMLSFNPIARSASAQLPVPEDESLGVHFRFKRDITNVNTDYFRLSPDGKLLARLYVDQIYLYSTTSGDLLSRTRNTNDPKNEEIKYKWFAFSTDCKSIICHWEHSNFPHSDVYENYCIQVLDVDDLNILKSKIKDVYEDNNCNLIMLPGDKRLLLLPYWASYIYLGALTNNINIKGTKLKTIYHAEKERFTDISASSDGTTLAASNKDDTIKVWDISEGVFKPLYNIEEEEVQHISFLPSGRLLALANTTTTKLWDMKARKVVSSIKGCYGHIAVSADGKMIAATTDGTLKIFDVGSGSLRTTLFEKKMVSNGEWSVQDVSWSTNGKVIVGRIEYDGPSVRNDMFKIWRVEKDE